MKRTKVFRHIKILKEKVEGHTEYYFTIDFSYTGENVIDDWSIYGEFLISSPVYPTVAKRNAAIKKFKKLWIRFCNGLDKI
jgi:hypothetical protein